MKIFRTNVTSWRFAIDNYLRGMINRLKPIICNYLNNVTKGWSEKTKKTFWLFLILVGAGVSLDVVAVAILKSKASDAFQRTKSIVLFIPKSYPDLHRERLSICLIKLQEYKRFLDSLSLNDTVRYRAILKWQPCILDSIHGLELLLLKKLNK